MPVQLAATIPATATFVRPPQQPPLQKQERPARLSPDVRARLQDGRIAMLKESLKLNDDQQKLWAPAEQQMRAGFAARYQEFPEREQRRQQATVPPSLPDRLDRASQRMAQRSQRMQAFATTFRRSTRPCRTSGRGSQAFSAARVACWLEGTWPSLGDAQGPGRSAAAAIARRSASARLVTPSIRQMFRRKLSPHWWAASLIARRRSSVVAGSKPRRPARLGVRPRAAP